MICQKCGNKIEDSMKFCCNCGTSFSIGNNFNNSETTTFRTNRNKYLPIIITAAILLIIILTTSIIVSKKINIISFKDDTQINSEYHLNSKACTDCLELVNEIRSKDIEILINETTVEDEFLIDNDKFFSIYEPLFKTARGDNPTDFEVKFSQCSFMVAYTEFTARKFQYYRENMILGNTVSDDAEKFRKHADYIFNMLLSARTESDLQVIIDYCSENGIITLKSQ